MATICYLVAVFTTSNLGNIILFLFFFYILFFDRSRFNKSMVLCYFGFIALFIIKISPSNLNYMNHKFKELLHLKEPLIKVHFEDHSEKDELINRYIYKYHKEFINRSNKGDLVDKIYSYREQKDSIPLTDTVYMNEISSIHSPRLPPL